MRTVLLCVVALSALAGNVARAADPKPATPDRGGWPDTRVGELARGWVTAFSTGEAAMKDYLAANLAPKSLESKTVPQRIERYRDLKKKYGKLELASVVKSEPAKLTVKLMASDATRYEFVFTAQPEAPHKLISVGIREHAHGHGGLGH